MSTTRDWLPADRQGQLDFCHNWISVMDAATRTAWGIPTDNFTVLGTAYSAAKVLLEKATSSERTAVITAECQAAFKVMTDTMRDFKRRFFLSPPLQDPADYVRLGLKAPDNTPTKTGAPTAQVGQKAYGFLSRSLRLAANSTQTPGQYMAGVLRSKTPTLSGVSRIARHELGINILYVTGSPNDPANKGYRIWYSVIAPGETPPADPDDLRKSFYTKRKKDLIEFGFGDSGKTVYFAVQVENDGKKGNWGPLVNALIP
jgi:hypothetical protein